MFNLMMFNVDWQSGKATIPIGRMFEYTDDHIADQFRQNGNPLLDRLSALPCLSCEEGIENEVAHVGQINRARVAGGEVVLEIGFDAEVPALANNMLYAHRLELNMPRDFEFSVSGAPRPR